MKLETDDPIEIGSFRTHSGRIVIVDGAYADLWREAPARDHVDMMVKGPDAFDAGMAFDLSSHPLYLYDVEPEQVDERIEMFAEFVREAGLDARLEPLDEPVPHPRRIELHFETGVERAGIEFDGVWAAAADGLPVDTDLPVIGVPFAESTPFARRWRDVSVRASDEPVSYSELRGYAAVDAGNLLFIDPIALPRWSEGGEPGQSMSFLSASGAVERTPHESTEIPFGDNRALFFMNRWGDGLFEVFADFDELDRLVAIRAAVGSERTRRRYRSVMEGFGAEGPNLALVSRAVLEGASARFVYRSEPDHDRDSGWRVLEGGESEDFLEDTENVGIARLRDLTIQDETLRNIFSAPVGSVFERSGGEESWSEGDDWEPNP